MKLIDQVRTTLYVVMREECETRAKLEALVKQRDVLLSQIQVLEQAEKLAASQPSTDEQSAPKIPAATGDPPNAQ